jgi:hypothetical protein
VVTNFENLEYGHGISFSSAANCSTTGADLDIRTDSMLQASVLPPDTFNAHLSFDR